MQHNTPPRGQQKNTNITLQWGIGIVLTVVAVVLGYYLYAQYAGQVQSEPVNPMEQPEQTQTEENDANPNRAATTTTENNQAALQARVLEFSPTPTTTEAQQRRHFEAVRSLSKSGTTITINNCRAEPLVLSLPYGDSFSIENGGTQQLQIGFSREVSYTLSSSESATVDTGQVFEQPAVYGYSCLSDGDGQRGGVLLLTQQGNTEQ